MVNAPLSEPAPTNAVGARVTLAVWLQFPRRLALLLLAWLLSGVVIGTLVGVLAGKAPGGGPSDWAVSAVHQRPVAEVIAGRLPDTLRLVGAALALALVLALVLAWLAVLVHRLERRAGPVGSVLKGLGRLCSFALAALPAWVLGVVLTYFLISRLHVLPAEMLRVDGAVVDTLAGRLRLLVLPTVALAAFPTVATAQAVAREMTLSRTRGGGRLWLAGLFRALGTLLGQTGGLVGAAVMVETGFIWPGLGWTVVEGLIAHKDYPLVLGALTTLTLLILVGRGAAELFRWLERLVREEPVPAAPSPWPQRARQIYVAMALALLIVPLGLVAVGTFSPWEAAAAGGDIPLRVLHGARLSIAAAVIGAIGATLLGGAYGALTGQLASRRALWSESLADLLLWPADVALFLPAVPAALLVAQLLQPASPPVTGVSWGPVLGAVAIALLPRAVRAGQRLWLGRAREQTGAPLDGLGALLLSTSLLGLGLVLTLDYVRLGIPSPTPPLGRLLREGMDVYQTNLAAFLTPLFVLWACAVALYFAADALIGYFQDKGVLARLNE